jgi:hypothetical protein
MTGDEPTPHLAVVERFAAATAHFAFMAAVAEARQLLGSHA